MWEIGIGRGGGGGEWKDGWKDDVGWMR
jgi:hypothetical protein